MENIVEESKKEKPKFSLIKTSIKILNAIKNIIGIQFLFI